VAQINTDCRTAGIGCTDCKKRLYEGMLLAMSPIHERRNHYCRHLDLVSDIIDKGNRRAAAVAKATMEEVREAMKI